MSTSYKLARILFVLVLLTSFTVVSAQPSYACSCMQPPAPAQALSDAQAVFAGRVTQAPPSDSFTMNSMEPVMVAFEVSQVWKGPTNADMTIRTAASSASCGYAFSEGEEYIVYAWATEDGWLETNLCSRTAPLDAAAEDIAALGEGQTPAAAPSEPTAEPGTSSLMLWGAGAAILVGAIVAGALLRMRGVSGS